MSNGVVYRRVPPPDPALVAAARGCRVSDLHEALGPIKGRMATMSERMRPLALDVRMAGVAVTVRPAPGDNLMLHRALRLAERDQVLVVAAGAEAGAQWGYLAALYAERIGLAGVVVHGTIRDVDSLAERRYPVWSTAISPAHPEKKGPGAVEHSGRLRWGHRAPGRSDRGGRGRRDRRAARGRSSHHSSRARSRGG